MDMILTNLVICHSTLSCARSHHSSHCRTQSQIGPVPSYIEYEKKNHINNNNDGNTQVVKELKLENCSPKKKSRRLCKKEKRMLRRSKEVSLKKHIREQNALLRLSMYTDTFNEYKKNLDMLQEQMKLKPSLMRSVKCSQQLSNLYDKVEDSCREMINFQHKSSNSKQKRYRFPTDKEMKSRSRNQRDTTKLTRSSNNKFEVEKDNMKAVYKVDASFYGIDIDSVSTSSDANQNSNSSDLEFIPDECSICNYKKNHRRNSKQPICKKSMYTSTSSSKNTNTTLESSTDSLSQYSCDDLRNDNVWVYELKEQNEDFSSFSRQCLVIIRGDHKSISFNSFTQLKQLKNKLSSYISEVIVIPRSTNGQIYIARGLQNSLHFSLGQKAVKRMTDIFKSCGVVIHNHDISFQKNYNSQFILDHGVFVDNFDCSHVNKEVKNNLARKLILVGKNIADVLFRVSVLCLFLLISET